ncbi:hypothetical protein ABD05_19620 [Burkholderia pyrrocinia]|nr:hypothetical protein ABD05_19620 [Burkholderia pyrrocinia]
MAARLDVWVPVIESLPSTNRRTALRNEIDARDAGLLQLATDRATEAVSAHLGDGPVAGKIQAHVIVATG